jgi:hypothetical protein
MQVKALCYPVLSDVRNDTDFCNVPRPCPFVLLVRSTDEDPSQCHYVHKNVTWTDLTSKPGLGDVDCELNSNFI